jgi:TPR repeat protein
MVFLGDLLTDRGDETEAEQWYRKAADNGDLDGICRFGACLAERGETAEAETLLRTAAEQGHVEAMFTLGVLYETDMDKKAESVRWYINAAERGAPVAMYFLGLHFEELGNLDEARNWLRDAADAGQPDAATRLSALLS